MIQVTLVFPIGCPNQYVSILLPEIPAIGARLSHAYGHFIVARQQWDCENESSPLVKVYCMYTKSIKEEL